MDERRVVDPSFLELVRLGVKKPDDPTILNSIAVVDQQLAVDTPNGRFWHRANFDGYGEQLDGQPWDSFPADSPRHPRPRVADLLRRARRVQPARRRHRPTPSWPRWRAPPTRAG